MKNYTNATQTTDLEAVVLQTINGGDSVMPIGSGNSYNPTTGQSGPLIYGPNPVIVKGDLPFTPKA